MWKDHAADMYLLIEDIAKNHHLQLRGYKGRFYYSFKPNLPYKEVDGTWHSQLKLLRQLKGRGAIDYEVKEAPKGLPDEFLSKNVGQFNGKTIRLKIDARVFPEVYSELKKYKDGRPVVDDAPTSVITCRETASGMVLELNSNTVRIASGSFKYDILKALATSTVPTSWDEIIEQMGEDAENRSFKKRVYKACYDLNSDLAPFGDEGLIVGSKGFYSINPTYILRRIT